MELLIQIVLLIVGACLALWGYNSDPMIVWAIIVGIILLAIGGVWLFADVSDL